MWAPSRSKDWPLADNQQGNRDLSPLTARNWIWATIWMNLDADLSPKPQKGMQLCWPPDFSTVNSKQLTLLSHATPTLWSAELWDSKFVLFWDAEFVTAATGNIHSHLRHLIELSRTHLPIFSFLGFLISLFFCLQFSPSLLLYMRFILVFLNIYNKYIL